MTSSLLLAAAVAVAAVGSEVGILVALLAMVVVGRAAVNSLSKQNYGGGQSSTGGIAAGACGGNLLPHLRVTQWCTCRRKGQDD